uniref:Uncharacterized protein n=1 Tax=Coturnix japonica TaxID=93934 RepID=A0A8C2TT15_COTJA
MSRVPVGKVLLRNVIRHTGAHNKVRPGPARGNRSARKRPGKCLLGNLPLPLSRKVTLPLQAAQPAAALRTVGMRRKKRNSSLKRERNVTTRCRSDTVR